jgi:hypothetical protein
MCGRLRKGEEPRFPINVGGEIDGSSATIRIYGDALDPTELTALLATAPTVARRKGDAIPGRRRQMFAKSGLWLLESQLGEKARLNDKVKDLLDRTTDDLAIWAAVTDRFRVDLFCGIYVGEWNRGFDLSVETLQRLAERHIPVCFDIYADVHFPEEGLHLEKDEES